MEWDTGPPPMFSALFQQAPFDSYKAKPDRFRLEWGPIYYRGRMDGTARVLLIGQDPAADENVARRILVGDAGQRVQGFLRKLGVTRSYIMVNAFLYSIVGQFDEAMKTFADIPSVRNWRNGLLDALATPNTKAIVALGSAARHTIESWPGAAPFRTQGRVFFLFHPTARPDAKVLADWSQQLPGIAAKVPPDPDGMVDLTPYAGPKFAPRNLRRIPLYDFPFGVPTWMGTGDMAVRRTVNGKRAILWTALDTEG